mmetsp:Transcript_36059/g.108979  ORF Transcript_36059/g.108979 Transcript_36059/m.108979 type:complete len:267 (-) Transcript_36059:1291-2091(-)
MRSPSQREHLPHADHWSHSQFWGATHVRRLHGLSSLSAPLHSLPPFFGKLAILRKRWRWPPSHVRLHSDQSCHSASAQSTGAFPSNPHASTSALAFTASLPAAAERRAKASFAPLQALVCSKGSESSALPHHLPAPSPWTAMSRVRDCTPSQVWEQAPQSDQSARSQSTSPSHGSSPHLRVSVASPMAGMPHGDAGLATLRCLQAKPPPQEREHSPQGCHSPQTPSTQTSQHGSTLHGLTSVVLAKDSHVLPPREGCFATRRWRLA